MMRKLVVLITALLLLPCGTAMAEKMYKWVDSQGNVSYHDRPPISDTGYRVEEKNVNARPARGSEDAGEKLPVVLYSVPVCAPCDQARAQLKKRKVTFTEKNVEKDVKLQEELKKKSGSLTVPALTVGTKVLSTYSEGWLDSELDQAGYAKANSDKPDEKLEKPAEDDTNKAPVR